MAYKDPEVRKAKNREQQIRRSKTEKGKALHAEKRRIYRSTPEGSFKDAARAKVAQAVKSGKLIRLPCLVCGDPNSQAHHEDYSKPLEVQWLCQHHHSNEVNNVGVVI